MIVHDLKPPDILNDLMKYADDVSLLCPQKSSTPIELEMAGGPCHRLGQRKLMSAGNSKE